MDKKVLKYSEVKQDKLEIISYDKIVGYAGRARKPMVDWVTEYSYISKNNLTQEQFDKILKEQECNPCGVISYIKQVLTFANGEKLFKHICKAVMY